MDKQRNQRGFTLPGSRPAHRTISYEDFRKQRDLTMSSKKSVVTDSSSSIRKAKSDTDIAMQSLKKKAEVSLLFNLLLVYGETCHWSNTALFYMDTYSLS